MLTMLTLSKYLCLVEAICSKGPLKCLDILTQKSYRLNCQFSIRRRSIISCFSLFLFYVALFNLTLQIWHLRHFLAQIYGRIAAEYSKKYRKNVIYRPQNWNSLCHSPLNDSVFNNRLLWRKPLCPPWFKQNEIMNKLLNNYVWNKRDNMVATREILRRWGQDSNWHQGSKLM